MFDRSVVARANMHSAEMIDAARADQMVRDESVSDVISHQIGHAARALGEKLVAIGEQMDRHEDCGDCSSVGSTGLAQL
jgi:hypothetical protein